MVEPRFCSECGSDLSLQLHVNYRNFYVDKNDLHEDESSRFYPTFVVCCKRNVNHDIEKNLSEEKSNEFFEWKKRLVEYAIKKFDLNY